MGTEDRNHRNHRDVSEDLSKFAACQVCLDCWGEHLWLLIFPYLCIKCLCQESRFKPKLKPKDQASESEGEKYDVGKIIKVKTNVYLAMFNACDYRILDWNKNLFRQVFSHKMFHFSWSGRCVNCGWFKNICSSLAVVEQLLLRVCKYDRTTLVTTRGWTRGHVWHLFRTRDGKHLQDYIPCNVRVANGSEHPRIK